MGEQSMGGKCNKACTRLHGSRRGSECPQGLQPLHSRLALSRSPTG